MGEFVHLHVHTDFSLLESAAAVSWADLKDAETRKRKTDLVGLALANHSPAMAITDRGVMGGAVEFARAMSGAGIKPIVGCEVNVAEGSRLEQPPNENRYRLPLLAINETGYRNLCKIVTDSHLNGFHGEPRTDKKFLAEHSGGLIALSGSLYGEAAKSFLSRGSEALRKTIEEYRNLFGKDCFYLEVADHGVEEEKRLNRALGELSRTDGIPLVATNEIFYPTKDLAAAQELLLCVGNRTRLDDPNRIRLETPEYYFKSGAEMEALFGSEFPEALTQTLRIAEQCEFKFDFQSNHYPVFPMEAGKRQIELLREFCRKGCAERYGTVTEEIQTRTEYELSVIEKTGYTSYFLVVRDFVAAAKEKGIPVGPGRGSGAGSLVAYLTGITDVDPLRYHLIFERFLNPERVSPPDFDIDFCERRRGEVIDYVTRKYGADRVAQIAAYGTLKAKAVLKDAARVLGGTPAEADRITKMIPNDPSMTLAKAYKNVREFREFVNTDPNAKRIFDNALPLEGLNRNIGIHAAGVIIGDEPLERLVPLCRGAHGETVVQYEARPCEELGLLKMDFLGLKTLTVIDDAVKDIRKNRKIPFDIEKIPLDDAKTFDLLNRGDTAAVFQLESGGMQGLCRRFVVESIENIIALIAIYRPGPMEFIPAFIARKKGLEKIEYDHPLMEPILRETYGIMLYQEQIMEVVRTLAGFSLGHADLVRRAIGKKKTDVMEKQREEFIAGCASANGIDPDTAGRIWEKIKKFAGYGFNKSHSAAYGILSYRTAYLKANYPAEYLAAVLTGELEKTEKVTFLIRACKDAGIPVEAPEVNVSDTGFSVSGQSIVFGLGAIRGLGTGAADAIIRERETNGIYRGLEDFLERTGNAVNNKAVESLIRAGAFDFTGHKRSQMLAVLNDAALHAAAKRKDRESGQGSLFETDAFPVPSLPDIPELPDSEKLNDEKELLGFYVSGHPSEKYAVAFDAYSTAGTDRLCELADGTEIRLSGVIKSVSQKISKRNNTPFAVVEVEDLNGSVEAVLFGPVYEQALPLLKKDSPVTVTANVRRKEENSAPTLSVREMLPLEKVIAERTARLHLRVYDFPDPKELFQQLRQTLLNNAGPVPVNIYIATDSGIALVRAHEKFGILPSAALFNELKNLLGKSNFKIEVMKG